MRTISYAEGYSDYYRHPIRPMTEAKARKRHEQRKFYTAVIEEEGKSVVTVEIHFQEFFCTVDFLDEQGRWGRRYSFVPIEGGRLFLQEIAENTYKGDARLGADSEIMIISQSGAVRVISSKDKRVESKNLIGRLGNLSGFYEPEPAFGEYDSLIREERGLDLDNVVQDAA